MRKSFHLVRSATLAIAATLALGSTSLVAQSADPAAAPADTVVIPPPVAVVPPAPVAPVATTPPIQVSQPVVQAVPTPPVITPPPAPAETASRPAAKRTAAPGMAPTMAKRSPAAATAPVASAPAPEPVVSPSEAAEVLPPAPIVDNSATTAAQQTQPARSPMLLNLIVLGGLLLLVLGVLAVLYRRVARRNRAETVVPVERTSRPVAMPRSEPARAAVPPEIAAVTAPAAPAMAEPPCFEPTPIRRDMASPMRRPTTPGALPSAGAAVDLPARVPEDYEERSALLKRMIEARPDKANPFTNRKSRAKRARLILQSLGRKFEDADPWIDLSQYPNNWPELARRYSQAA
jgi:hypothetical protein